MPTFTENTTSQNSADTPTTGVTEDSWLQESDGGTVNHGSSTRMEVQKFGVADHGHTVIRFDTTGESGTVSSATLYLYQEGNNGEAHDVAVRELLQTGWDICRAPAGALQISWGVTGIVSANLGGSIEFHLELDEVGNAGDYTWWATSEGTDGERPELVVVYSGAAAVPQAAFNYRLRR